MQACIWSSSSSSIRATGMPACMVAMVRLDRRLQVGELADGGRHRLRDAVQAEADLGDDAERALGADHQPGQVVAVGGLAGAAAGVDDAAIGEDHLEAQHVLADGAVADGVGAGGAGRAHAADGAVAAGVDREEHALVAQVVVELLAGDAGLDQAVHVLGVDLEDRWSCGRGRGRCPARTGLTWPSSDGAGAEGDDGDAMLVAERQDAADLLGRLHEGDGVGQGRRGLCPRRGCAARGWPGLVVRRSPRRSRTAAMTASTGRAAMVFMRVSSSRRSGQVRQCGPPPPAVKSDRAGSRTVSPSARRAAFRAALSRADITRPPPRERMLQPSCMASR